MFLLGYYFIVKFSRRIRLILFSNEHDFDDFLICRRGHDSEQLSPIHIIIARPWFPRYLQKTVDATTPNYIYN